jgi:hypothetical protein
LAKTEWQRMKLELEQFGTTLLDRERIQIG